MSTMAIGRTALLVLVAALLAAPAACQEFHSHDDEFSLLGIPRPAGMPFGFGMPMLNVGKLIDSIVGDVEDRATAQPAEKTHIRVFHMPPMLSSLLRGTVQPPQPVQERPQVVKMRFMMPTQFHISQPLQQLRNLASACVPCADANRVQAHMRSISVMNGPNGERVETVTETGPDGEEHTTRKVTKAQAQSGSVQDLMDDVIAPLMGGMPDIERIMNDVQSVDSEDIDAPLDAPKEVSKDYKAAIESSLAAEALDLDSADKRQKLAKNIADKLGVSPEAVKVSVDKSDEASGEEEEEEAVADEGAEHMKDMEDEDADALPDDAPLEDMEDEEDADALPVDAPPVDESDLDEDEAADVAADQDSEDVDEFGKEFDQEEEDKEAVVKREEETMEKVSQAADEAQDKADHLKALEKKIKQSSSLVA